MYHRVTVNKSKSAPGPHRLSCTHLASRCVKLQEKAILKVCGTRHVNDTMPVLNRVLFKMLTY